MAIQRSAEVKALGPSAEHDIEGVHDLLANLSQGVGPRPKDMATWNGFYMKVMKRVENFFTKEVPVEDAADKKLNLFAPKFKTKYGAEALIRHYLDVKLKFDSDEGCKEVSMAELQPLRTYGWLLSVEKAGHVKRWIGQVASRLGSAGTSKAAIADSVGGGAIAVAGLAASSSSAALGKSPATSKKAQAQESKAADAHTNMLRFFVAGKS